MTELVLSISVHELCQYEGLSEHIIVQVDWVFDTTSVHWLRKAVRLHADLDIDWVAVAMVIELLQKNEALERRNQCFEQQLKRFMES